jgi:hypothetical protein
MGGIYIASKAKHGWRWRQLRDSGLPIVSSWIDESGDGQTTDWSDLWNRNVSEASAALALIVYNESGEQMKGALVEIGSALAFGVPVFWVGTYHDLDGKEYTVVRHRLVTRCLSLTHAINQAKAFCVLADNLQR